jgi:hypothetical protein
MSTTTTVDWEAVERVAAGLGVHTRHLVAERDPEAVRDWALKLAGENNIYPGTQQRAASYHELAVCVGYEPPEEDPDEDTGDPENEPAIDPEEEEHPGEEAE